jgi:hypothetical protein
MKIGSLHFTVATVAMGPAGILLGVIAFLILPVAYAQEGPPEVPPFPTLYGGRALVDGEPLPDGTRLTARIGDYETVVVVEEEGYYRNLLLAPPSGDYYSRAVTFHALNMTAAENDVFVQTAAPVFKDVGFDIHFTQATLGGTFAFFPWVLFIGVFLFLAVLIGWLAARKRRPA